MTSCDILLTLARLHMKEKLYDRAVELVLQAQVHSVCVCVVGGEGSELVLLVPYCAIEGSAVVCVCSRTLLCSCPVCVCSCTLLCSCPVCVCCACSSVPSVHP